eukprot:TRINITY_DN75120_c0_g1_i1.p1 TRINITY_DN75120_c0_g1~~TRINITY_DN75120_c0_g1_i1.p1  ORF type:complete len:678 (+),score=83.20 TRINITY_DN75120_c0_g1_i1:57-2036(+)
MTHYDDLPPRGNSPLRCTDLRLITATSPRRTDGEITAAERCRKLGAAGEMRPWAVAVVTAMIMQLPIAPCVATDADEIVWPECDNRAERNADVEPGGLRLLGVTESPLGAFPEGPAAASVEHLVQQLSEVWSDDCPRVLTEIGLQPAAGPLKNWSTAALWLQYFSSSGSVFVIDPVDDYLRHAQDALRRHPSSKRVKLIATRAAIAAESRGSKRAERPVNFDTPPSPPPPEIVASLVSAPRKVLAADTAIKMCSGHSADPMAEEPGHPCEYVLKSMARPEPLEYNAPMVAFDELWRRELRGRHIDFLRVNIGMRGMAEIFQKGFANLFQRREVSVVSFRLDTFWTKAELKSVVEWLHGLEYFTLFQLLCTNSDQVGSFVYASPDSSAIGPTTYLPITDVDFDKVHWKQLPKPQDIVVFDMRQPDLFKVIQIGDEQCGAAESGGDKTCAAGSDESVCQRGGSVVSKPPHQPIGLRIVRSESRSLTLEWQAHPDGPRPATYVLRVDPGSWESTLEHDNFDELSGLQLHKVDGLRPGTEYSIRLEAANSVGTSAAVTLRQRTEIEKPPVAKLHYDLAESTHCGMSTSEEVRPTGPPPQGRSFFMDTLDVEGCRIRCDDLRQCVAFQVKIGEACWLYRQRPFQERLIGPKTDEGWACGVRRQP